MSRMEPEIIMHAPVGYAAKTEQALASIKADANRRAASRRACCAW